MNDEDAYRNLANELSIKILNRDFDEKTEELKPNGVIEEEDSKVNLSLGDHIDGIRKNLAELEDDMRDAYKRLTGELEALEERVKTLESKEPYGGYPWPGTWPPYNPAQPYTPITDPVNPVTPSDPVWPSYPVTPGYPTSPWTTPWITWQNQPWWQYYTTTTSDTANTTSNLKK